MDNSLLILSLSDFIAATSFRPGAASLRASDKFAMLPLMFALPSCLNVYTVGVNFNHPRNQLMDYWLYAEKPPIYIQLNGSMKPTSAVLSSECHVESGVSVS